MFSEKDVTKPSAFLCVFYMVIGFALSLVGFVAIPWIWPFARPWIHAMTA